MRRSKYKRKLPSCPPEPQRQPRDVPPAMQSRSKASAAQQETGSSKRIKIHSVRTKHLCAGIRALRAAPAPLIGVGGTAGGWGQRGWVTAAASSTRVSPRLSQPRGEVKGRLGGAQGELGHPSCQNPPGEGETTRSCPPNPPVVPAESHCQGRVPPPPSHSRGDVASDATGALGAAAEGSVGSRDLCAPHPNNRGI